MKGEPQRFIRGHRKIVDPMTLFVRTDGCWLWRGSFRLGYGYYDNVPAHRLVYERLVGPVPEGLELDHVCRIRECVNPAHLQPVTRAVNVQRGRKAKLTPADVLTIRAARIAGSSCAALARQFGVTTTLISMIVRGLVWKDVGRTLEFNAAIPGKEALP